MRVYIHIHTLLSPSGIQTIELWERGERERCAHTLSIERGGEGGRKERERERARGLLPTNQHRIPGLDLYYTNPYLPVLRVLAKRTGEKGEEY